MSDAMVAMTDYASGKPRGLKRGFMRALLEHLILKNVAFRADVLHGVDAWRRGTVVAMASGARGRAEIATDSEGIVMDAGAVFRKLVGWNGISLHVSGVGVTPGARPRNV